MHARLWTTMVFLKYLPIQTMKVSSLKSKIMARVYQMDIQSNIFNPFFTTKKKGEGSGLGLDIVRRIIENQNGHIKFTSTVDQGTTFFVQLPLFA